MNNQELAELKRVLDELVKILAAERELANSPWVTLAQRLVGEADTHPEALSRLKSLIRGVPTGPGSLYDLVLWRDDFEERKRVNNHLDSLRWRVLELVDQL